MFDRRSLVRAAMGACAIAFSSFADASSELPKPSGEVVLTVTGKIGRTNAPGRADFDRAMLEALGVSELRTSHSWAETVTAFEGVNVGKLLAAVEAQGAQTKATAINNYAIELETAEMRKYPVMLAMKADGADLRRRDRGPIWIVYPRDSFPELQDGKHNYKWIWQLRSLEIR